MAYTQTFSLFQPNSCEQILKKKLCKGRLKDGQTAGSCLKNQLIFLLINIICHMLIYLSKVKIIIFLHFSDVLFELFIKASLAPSPLKLKV